MLEQMNLEVYRRLHRPPGDAGHLLDLAPSVLSIPLVVTRFVWNEVLTKRSLLTRRRWENALAPLLGIVVGSARATFGYYLVTATRGR
jgi:hypothetical protein